MKRIAILALLLLIPLSLVEWRQFNASSTHGDAPAASKTQPIDCADALFAAVCPHPDATSSIIAPAGFVPGQVLANLPVYPGAARSNGILVGAGGFPVQPNPGSMCDGSPCPSVQSAQAEYHTADTPDAVLTWYQAQLEKLGYQRSGASYGSAPQGYHRSELEFFNPERPAVTVHVYAFYRSAKQGGSVIVLDVVNPATAPRPVSSYVPPGVSEVDIAYFPGGHGSTTTLTVTDKAAIRSLVRAVNRLPIRSNWLTSGGPLFLGDRPPAPPGARIQFVSAEGEWAVHWGGGEPISVEPSGTELDDPHGVFWLKVMSLIHPNAGSMPPPNSVLPLPGTAPTPVPTLIPTARG